MCRVVCVKICEVFREADEHSFAVRMHKPDSGVRSLGEVPRETCSCWYLFGVVGSPVQNRFVSSDRRSETGDLFA